MLNWRAQMRTLGWLVFLLFPAVLGACHDDGLGVPAGQVDGGGTDGASAPLPACSTIKDTQACAARPDCEPTGCPDCHGVFDFRGCVMVGHGVFDCPQPVCPPDCSAHTDETSCKGDSACYAIYDDLGLCDCAQRGCCMGFVRCANGSAACSQSGTGPLCEEPPWDCGPNYAPAFQGTCQVGCVTLDICADDCRTTGCPTGQTCELCWATYQCMSGGNPC